MISTRTANIKATCITTYTSYYAVIQVKNNLFSWSDRFLRLMRSSLKEINQINNTVGLMCSQLEALALNVAAALGIIFFFKEF